METAFLTLAPGICAQAELLVKRSRFLACACRTETEDAARAFIESQRKRFPDARHHCSAFTLLPPNWEPGAPALTRSSDDGEPSGTAGRPMLDVLLGSNLDNVTVVVTRYFGGVKLGTGGLVRAYSGVVRQALDSAKRVRVKNTPVVRFDVALTKAPGLESWLRERAITPISVTWGEEATFRLALDGLEAADLAAALGEKLAASLTLIPEGTRTVETPA